MTESSSNQVGIWHRYTAAEADKRFRLVPTVEHPCLILDEKNGYVRVANINALGVRLTIGRTYDNHLPIPNNSHVSGTHAVLERRVGLFTVEDHGSRNGTFVNDRRVTSAQPLHDGDELVIATTKILVRCPTTSEGTGTTVLPSEPDWAALWPSERRVLIGIIDVLRENHGRPPSNQQLADHLSLSIAAVRKALRTAREKLRDGGITDVRMNALTDALMLHEGALRAAAAKDPR